MILWVITTKWISLLLEILLYSDYPIVVSSPSPLPVVFFLSGCFHSKVLYFDFWCVLCQLYILHHLFTGSGSARDRDTFYSIYFISVLKELLDYHENIENNSVVIFLSLNYRSYKILENFGGFEIYHTWMFGPWMISFQTYLIGKFI